MPPLGSFIAPVLLLAAILVTSAFSYRRARGKAWPRLIPAIGIAGLLVAGIGAHSAGLSAARQANKTAAIQMSSQAHWDAVTLKDAKEFCRSQQIVASQDASEDSVGVSGNQSVSEKCETDMAAKVAENRRGNVVAAQAALAAADKAYWDAALSWATRGACVTLALLLVCLGTAGLKRRSE